MITLSEALQAKNELERLQQAANLAPVLQQEADKEQSQQYLENLRVSVLQENTKLYNDFQAIAKEYRTQYEQVLQAVKELSATLKRLLTVKRHIQDNAARYSNAHYQHGVKFLEKEPYSYGLEVEIKANDVIPGRIDYNLSIPGNAIAGELFRIISNIS